MHIRSLRLNACFFIATSLTALAASMCHAQSLQNVTYVGGTAMNGNGIHGKVLVSSKDAMIFEGLTRLSVPYDHITDYESKPHRKVHVGLLTEGVWKLIAPWPEGKQLSVSYRDAEDRPQVMVLQMSRGDESLLVDVLKARVPRGAPRQLATPRGQHL